MARKKYQLIISSKLRYTLVKIILKRISYKTNKRKLSCLVCAFNVSTKILSLWCVFCLHLIDKLNCHRWQYHVWQTEKRIKRARSVQKLYNSSHFINLWWRSDDAKTIWFFLLFLYTILNMKLLFMFAFYSWKYIVRRVLLASLCNFFSFVVCWEIWKRKDWGIQLLPSRTI